MLNDAYYLNEFWLGLDIGRYYKHYTIYYNIFPDYRAS